jgi:hypothetical protein
MLTAAVADLIEPDDLIDKNKPVVDVQVSKEKCAMCQLNEHKYKCPRCEMKTCSLACCRQHKQSTSCSGVRDKVRFVDKEQFDERLLLNDYQFLEEQARLVDNYQRFEESDNIGKAHGGGNSISNALKPLHYGVYENLRKFVQKNYNIKLLIMPAQSTRHLNNRTRFNRHSSMVSWSLEFVFHLDGSGNQRELFKFDTKAYIFSAKESVKSVVLQFYRKFKPTLFERERLTKKSEFLLCTQYGDLLEKETALDDQLDVLYEVLDYKKSKRYFIKFNTQQSLEENLRNKTIIEYPTLHVIRSENLKDYLVRTEEEEKEEEGEKEEEEEDDQDVDNLKSSADLKQSDDENEEGELLYDDIEEDAKASSSVAEAAAVKRVKIQSENNTESNFKRLKLDPSQMEDGELEEGEEIDD